MEDWGFVNVRLDIFRLPDEAALLLVMGAGVGLKESIPAAAGLVGWSDTRHSGALRSVSGSIGVRGVSSLVVSVGLRAGNVTETCGGSRVLSRGTRCVVVNTYSSYCPDDETSWGGVDVNVKTEAALSLVVSCAACAGVEEFSGCSAVPVGLGNGIAGTSKLDGFLMPKCVPVWPWTTFFGRRGDPVILAMS